jgi:hypothetical protein
MTVVLLAELVYYRNKEYFLNLPPSHIITILLDNGYHKEYLEKEISKIDPQLRNKIDIQISAKITQNRKLSPKKKTRKTRLCSNQKEMYGRKNQRLDQSM